jgi:hypothetical protein
MRANTHKYSRYANTLLVSLNNRIYFREHASTVLRSSDNLMGSDHGRDAASRHFHEVQVGMPDRAAAIGNSFKLDRLSSHTIELNSERVKVDVVSINSNR